MSHGGARPGAGRPSGRRNKTADAKRVIEDHATKMATVVSPDIGGMAPLNIMLHAMHLEASEGRWVHAAKLAADAAPYCHPRLSAVDMKTTMESDPSKMSDQELLAIVAAGTGRDPEQLAALFGIGGDDGPERVN